MFTQVAVVPLEEPQMDLVEKLLPIVGAIQVQVQRDLGPHWGLHAAVSAFPSLEATPQGAWPVAVATRQRPPVDGFHFVMNGLPFGIVKDSAQLSVVLSHEIAEMLVDPFGQRKLAGPSPEAADAGRSLPWPETVEYFVEVCDPCEGETYQIDRVPVSDFVLPGYYATHRPRFHGYSFTGALSAPRQVCEGGYLTWRDQFPQDAVFQAFALGKDVQTNVQKLLRGGAADLTPVKNPGLGADSAANPGSDADTDTNPGSGADRNRVKQLQVLKLANAPTRAWRELVAELAREDSNQTQLVSTSQATASNEDSAQADHTGNDDSALARVDFAREFRTNVKALLETMANDEPPLSITELLRAVENPDAPKTFGQTVLKSTKENRIDDTERRERIIRYLKQQERLAGIFGPDIDPGLASWMYMIMP